MKMIMINKQQACDIKVKPQQHQMDITRALNDWPQIWLLHPLP